MHKRGKTDSGSDTVQIDFLTITEENVEKIKCRSDTDHREETQL